MSIEAKIAKKDWHRVPKYQDYPYIATIKIEKATSEMFPYTEFEKQEAESGNYAEICESFNGGVYIYAKEPPEKDITVNVHLFKGGL